MKLHKLLILLFIGLLGFQLYQSRHAIMGGDDTTSGASDSSGTGDNSDSSSGSHGFFGGLFKDLNGHGSLAKTVQDARKASHAGYASGDVKYNSSQFSGGGIGKVGTLKDLNSGVYSGKGSTNTNNKFQFDNSHSISRVHEAQSGPPDDLTLLQAADAGNEALVAQRLDGHVKVDSRDNQHRTPLMFASAKGFNDISARLIAAGASPAAEDQSGHNAFDYAAGSGRVDTVKFLLEHSHSEDENHYVEYASLIQAVSSGRLDLLPASGMNSEVVNRVSPQGQAPLHIAAGYGSVAMADALIQRGAKIDTANDSGQTALHWAAWDNQPAMIEMLLAKGAGINKPDLGGNTPLILAAQNNGKDAVKMLLAHGADKYVANQAGKTAGIIAEDKGYTDLAAQLK